jgi:hypothetical protein
LTFLPPDLDTAEALTAAEMAELAGVTLATFTQMRTPSRAAAVALAPPAPDFYEAEKRGGTSPRWYRETAHRWAAARAERVLPAPVVVAPPIGERPTLPVGYVEIAARLGVEHGTVKKWQQRGLLPEPMWTVSGGPCFDFWRKIYPWAIETGRLTGAPAPQPTP